MSHMPAAADAQPPNAAKVALILAGEVIFARDGIEGASLREIAARATLAGSIVLTLVFWILAYAYRG